MFHLAALAPALPPPRNAQPAARTVMRPEVVFAQHADAVTRWLKLKEFYVNQRGGSAIDGQRVVPNTTNADVLQLATHWSREVAKVSPRDAHDRSDHERWKACMDTIKQTADASRPDAVYAKNVEFWQQCSRRLAIYLNARKAVPSRWQMFKEAVVETIAGVPSAVGSATQTTAGLVTGAAGGVAKAFADPAKAALFVVGTAILLPPIIRAVRK